MAVGDAVSETGSASNYLYAQPAAGVEIMVTSFSSDGSMSPETWDGGKGSTFDPATNTAAFNCKIFCTSSNYFRVRVGAGAKGSYSGIQTK